MRCVGAHRDSEGEIRTLPLLDSSQTNHIYTVRLWTDRDKCRERFVYNKKEILKHRIHPVIRKSALLL